MRCTKGFAIGLCSSVLLLSRPASAQVPAAGDRDPGGRVYTKVVVTIAGESGAFGHPASGLRFLVVSENGDRVSIRTDDAGVASTWVFPGSYRFVTPDPYEWDGNAYTWDAIVAIRPGTGVIRLSQANARQIVAMTPAPPSRARPSPARRSGVAGMQEGLPVASVTEGFFFAPHLLGTSLEVNGGNVESGGGFGLSLGYGFTRMFAGFITLDAAKVEIRDPEIQGNYTLATGDLGVRLNFRPETQKAIPYLQAALAGRVAQTTFEGHDFEVSGPAFTVGGGLNYYFQPKVAFDVGLSYTFGRLDDFNVDGDNVPINDWDANGGRFQVGLTWFPFAGHRQ